LYPVLPYLLKALFSALECDDNEIQQQAVMVARQYPHYPHSPSVLKMALETLTLVLDHPTIPWRPKQHALAMIQILYYRHLPLLSQSMQMQVIERISHLLVYPQVEVREMAAQSLSGVIRCSQQQAVVALKSEFMATLSRYPIQRPVVAEDRLKRHGAILGLSSLVLAFPYHVPDWMPDLLIVLAKCISDPAPISASTCLIIIILGDFKTHVCRVSSHSSGHLA
jgi:proteasome activator subunit 4